MTQLLAIFTPKNPFTSIITQKDLESHLRVSSSLVKQVQEHPKQFAKFINQRQEHQIREIEKLTLMHLLFMHAPELADTFESMQLSLRADDPWINANIITPYQNFIRKLILSNQQYNKVRIINNGWNSLATSRDTFFNKQLMRQNPKIYFNFQVLCYCVNMLNQCLAFLKKVPTLGRYYPKNVNNCYSSFVNVASYQVVLFYFSFKFIANELLLRHKDYLLNEHEEKFFKDILQNRLQSINQEMKALLLNKYYNPIEKGIKITLLEIQRFSDQGRQALIELNILQRQNQQKTKKNRQFLGKKIFGGGDFDSNVFEQSINLISTREYRQLDLQEIYDKENMNIINKRAIQKPEMKDRLPNQQYSNNILTDL